MRLRKPRDHVVISFALLHVETLGLGLIGLCVTSLCAVKDAGRAALGAGDDGPKGTAGRTEYDPRDVVHPLAVGPYLSEFSKAAIIFRELFQVQSLDIQIGRTKPVAAGTRSA